MFQMHFWYQPIESLITSVTEAIGVYAHKSPWIGDDGRTVLDQRSGLGTPRDRQPGRALEFNGINQAVKLALNPIGNVDQSMTCWINPDVGGADGYVVSTRDGGLGGLSLFINGENRITTVVGSVARSTLSILPSDAWSLVTLNYIAATQTVEVYLDSNAVYTNDHSAEIFSANQQSHLGARGDGVGSFVKPIKAILSDARMYSRNLTTKEIASLHQQGQTPNRRLNGVPNDQVVGYYLDDKSTTTVLNNGTLGPEYAGSIQNGSVGMLHEGDDVPWSPQNLIGYSDGGDGPELVVNGSFDTDSDWAIVSADPASGISGGELYLLSDGSNARAQQTVPLIEGHQYRITLTLVSEATAGSTGYIRYNGVNLFPPGTLNPGDHSAVFVATGTNEDLYLMTYSGDGRASTFDSVSIRQHAAQGEYVPLKTADPNTDVLGNPAQYTGIVPRNMQLANSPCLTLDGVDDFIDLPHLVGDETLTHDGTSTLTVSAGRIDGTAGTVFNLMLSDGSDYSCQENAGSTIYDRSGSRNHGTLNNATLSAAWANKQDLNHSNITDGCDVAWFFDGASYVTANEMASDLILASKLELRFSFRTTETGGTFDRERIVFSLHNGSGGNIARVGISPLDGGVFVGSETVGADLSYGSGYNDGDYHDVVLILEDGKNPTLNVDGVIVPTSGVCDLDLTTVTQVSFGQEWDSNTASDLFIGKLSRLQVYGDDALVGKYCYTATDFSDESGNENDGVNVGVKITYLTAQTNGLSLINGSLALPSGVGLNIDSAALVGDDVATPEDRGLVLPAAYVKGDGSSGDWVVSSSTALLDSKFKIGNE